MKSISRKPNKDLNKSLSNIRNQNKYFQTSQIISEQGNFIKPSTIANYTDQKIHIICKGYGKDAVYIVNQLLVMIKQSMLCLVDQQSKLNQFTKRLQSDNFSQQNKQRYFMLNLIDSCFEQLGSKNIEGSCSFGICYILKDQLYIVKNKMIECYSITKKQAKKDIVFNTICSKKLPFQLNSVLNNINVTNQNSASKQTKGFLTCDKSYQNIIARKYFPEVQFHKMQIPKDQNMIFLMGNSQCFCHFNESQVISYFKNQHSLKQAGEKLIEESRKKWKTIYQQDMTMIVSVFS